MTVATGEEIKLLFLEFQSAGVIFHQTLKKQPLGAKNFIVKEIRTGICYRLPGPQTSSAGTVKGKIGGSSRIRDFLRLLMPGELARFASSNDAAASATHRMYVCRPIGE